MAVTPESFKSAASVVTAPPSPWWLRGLASLPLSVLQGLATGFAGFSTRFFPYRQSVVHDNLRRAFPELDDRQVAARAAEFYRNYCEVMAEIVKSASLPGEELDTRLRLRNLHELQAVVASGRSVVLFAAHQCNWEWLLLVLSRQLGCPLDAAYKPLKNAWADRAMRSVRSRFGARMIAAEHLLKDVIGRRRLPRVIALVADQEPKSSERRHWTTFLNRDSAFFMGGEVITKTLGYAAYFVAIRRVGKGRYEAWFEALSHPGESLAEGELTERYVRRVERQIHEGPADWPWSHKRWRLKKNADSKKEG
jgi:KDO2-lipid IV(A) lauroyltransferase